MHSKRLGLDGGIIVEIHLMPLLPGLLLNECYLTAYGNVGILHTNISPLHFQDFFHMRFQLIVWKGQAGIDMVSNDFRICVNREIPLSYCFMQMGMTEWDVT